MKNEKASTPPQWVRRFFTWYCGEVVAEDLVGDLDEFFFINVRTMSRARARRKYAGQAIMLVFSRGLHYRKRAHAGVTYHSFAMYSSYGKIAFRNLMRQKAFSLINMVCLAVGMSIGLLALAVWLDVREVDAFQVNRDDLYRITTTVNNGSTNLDYASSSAPIAEKVMEEVPGIEDVVEFDNDFNPVIVQSGNSEIPFQGYYASASFFNMFSFKLLEGNPQLALTKPFSVVLTIESARKLFRDASPMGKVVEVKGLGNFEVTGVMASHARSHLDFEMLASYSTLPVLESEGKRPSSLHDWGPVTSHYSYIRIRDRAASDKVGSLIARIVPPLVKKDKPLTATFGLQPFVEIPSGELRNEIGLSWGDLSLYLFFFMAFLVLLPACFNYTNIAIARSLRRAKEIGLRKVSGGQSRHIFFQMIAETVLLSVTSLSLAVLLFTLSRNGFLAMVANGTKVFDLEITPLTLIAFLGFGIFTGIAAGIFPALYFSRLNPIETLRNASQTGKLSKISIRRGIIVAQFALSLFFILSVTIVVKQYHYALNYNTGFQKKNILDIPLKNVKPEILKTELMKIPGVKTVSMASALPGQWQFSGIYVKPANSQDSLEVYQMFVDDTYLENLEIKLLAGRPFAGHSGPENGVIVNETLLRNFKLGTPSQSIGKFLTISGKEFRVAGVVKDFNYMPLQEQIRNFFFRYDPAAYRYTNVKLATTDIVATLDHISAAWYKLTDQSLDAKFLDDELDASLKSYSSMIRIFGGMGILAVTISCLGLLAVVISAAESRTKEMGIRKILGASAPQLAGTLSGSFAALIGLAILIATPVTIIIAQNVFLRFSFYHGTIGVLEIAGGILLLLFLVTVIIGSQTRKATRVNLVDAIKWE